MKELEHIITVMTVDKKDKNLPSAELLDEDFDGDVDTFLAKLEEINKDFCNQCIKKEE